MQCKKLGIFIFSSIILFSSCSMNTESNTKKLIIFHAGSLSVPFKQIAKKFEEENPGIELVLEAAGSRKCARKVIDLKKECDILASADYTVIDELLIPEFTNWNIKFASNEMAIVFHEKSNFSNEINATNWYNILESEEVIFGRSDPNSDPCGYRAVLTIKLADNHYKNQISDKLLNKDLNYIRPKETDLIALLESNNIDYIFLYRSVAEQHGLKYVLLPDEINLKNPVYSDYYSEAEIQISGKKPGELVTKKGEAMVYGITIIKNTTKRDLALNFVDFVLNEEKGMNIMEANGQPSLIPSHSASFDSIPESLKKYALK